MESLSSLLDRRHFLKSVALAGAGSMLGSVAIGTRAQAAPAKKNIKLGIDNFAVRAMEWKAAALIDYSASLKLDSLLISDLDALESFDESYLSGLRKKGADAGLQIHLGTWSICPTSTTFKNKWGTAEEHLGLAIRTAKGLGSPVIRVVLGSIGDRNTEGGIEARIRDTVKVCKALRSQAIDAGVKIAVENHAGDMQSRELVGLIEEAGRDYVGANVDSGNAFWALESAQGNLEILGQYALTTSLRDTAVWESANGYTVQWTAMGDGNVDLPAYFQRFAELCPNVPVHIETISGFNREIPYLTPGFWKPWPRARAEDLAALLVLAKKGKPREAITIPNGPNKKAEEQAFQKAQVERSIRYCKETLGLGLKS